MATRILFFSIVLGCRLFILCEIYCYLCPPFLRYINLVSARVKCNFTMTMAPLCINYIGRTIFLSFLPYLLPSDPYHKTVHRRRIQIHSSIFSAMQCAEIPFITKVFPVLNRITLNSTAGVSWEHASTHTSPPSPPRTLHITEQKITLRQTQLWLVARPSKCSILECVYM